MYSEKNDKTFFILMGFFLKKNNLGAYLLIIWIKFILKHLLYVNPHPALLANPTYNVSLIICVSNFSNVGHFGKKWIAQAPQQNSVTTKLALVTYDSLDDNEKLSERLQKKFCCYGFAFQECKINIKGRVCNLMYKQVLRWTAEKLSILCT